MTTKEIFKEMKRTVKTGSTYYLSGSKKKMTMISNLINKFESDSNIDFDLGVITAKKHAEEMKMVSLMKKSVELAEIF